DVDKHIPTKDTTSPIVDDVSRYSTQTVRTMSSTPLSHSTISSFSTSASPLNKTTQPVLSTIQQIVSQIPLSSSTSAPNSTDLLASSNKPSVATVDFSFNGEQLNRQQNEQVPSIKPQQQIESDRSDYVRSPISQVRSYVEKQMDQLQEDLKTGFKIKKNIYENSTIANTATNGIKHDPWYDRPLNIPVDMLSNSQKYSSPSQYQHPTSSLSILHYQSDDEPPSLHSSLKKPLSPSFDIPPNDLLLNSKQTYGLHINPNERVIHYLNPYSSTSSLHKQSLPLTTRPISSYIKRSVQDLSSNNHHHHHHHHQQQRSETADAYLQDKNINELRFAMLSPQQQPHFHNRQQHRLQTDKQFLTTNQPQKRVTINVGDTTTNDIKRTNSKTLLTQLNKVPRKTNFDDQSWIISDDEHKIKYTTEQRPQTTNEFHSVHNSGQEMFISTLSAANSEGHVPFSLDRRRSTLASQHYPHHQQQLYRQDLNNNNRLLTESYSYDYLTGKNDYQSSMKQKQRLNDISPTKSRVLSVSGKLRCSKCNDELGQGSAMVIESLGLYYHIECFRCCVCNTQLSTGAEGTDVRVRNQRLHCQNCFSDDNGAWRSN
ncbi:unnamed protein product, partial [Didymodactylos carnosus]